MENKTNEEIVNDIINKCSISDNSANNTIQDGNNHLENTAIPDHPIHFSHSSNAERSAANDINSDECDEASTNPLEDVDEDTLRHLEESMSESDKETHKNEALDLKIKGNEEFQAEKYFESINLYTKALNICPLSYKIERSTFYCNRAAAKMKLGYTETAIEDCTKAIDLNSIYLKAYIRRAKLYEKTDKLDESLKDFTKILELDPANSEAKAASIRLPPLINERNEKLKTEMLGKLKELGNVVLRPFGLSTDNFKLQQDPNTGGYSINFQQNHKS